MESPTTTTVFSTKRLASRKNISRLNIRDFAGWCFRSFFLKVKFLLLRGEREALLARREFLQQLALWEEDVRIPLPGGNLRMIVTMMMIFDVFSGLLSK